MKRAVIALALGFTLACGSGDPVPPPAPPAPPPAPPATPPADAPPADLGATVTPREQAFARFWGDFRAAAEKGDAKALAALAKDPLETRGPMDEDEVMEWSGAAIEVVAKHYLKQDSGMGDDKTEAEALKAQPADVSVTTLAEINSGEVRVGDALFTGDDKGWKWTFAYLGYETIEAIQADLEKSDAPRPRPSSSTKVRPGAEGLHPGRPLPPGSSAVRKTRPQ